jgi:hypothetical protein
MGWFNKKEEENGGKPPSLPDLPNMNEPPKMNDNPKNISQLPSLPNNSFGQKFSQNTIKEAVAGKKEGMEFPKADDFKERMMPETPEFAHVPEPQKYEPQKPIIPQNKVPRSAKKQEPIFIRLDKFEESVDNFEEIKDQMSEIEKMLENTKELKEKEETEIQTWEQELSSIKKRIEKLDQEIFSKVE